MRLLLLEFYLIYFSPRFITLQHELRRITLMTENDHVGKFLTETEQPKHWKTPFKRVKRNVKPMRWIETQNFESQGKEDVVLFIPAEKYTAQGRSIKWERVGNLNMRKWLTLEQVDTINELYKATGDIALVLEKVYAQLLRTDGALREMALQSFRETCQQLLRLILDDEVADMYDFDRTEEEISRKWNQFYKQLGETKRKYASMIAPTCMLVKNINGLSSIRSPRKVNEDMQMQWLTKEQEMEIKTMIAEGAKNGTVLTKILEYFEDLDSSDQEKVSEDLKQLCQNHVTRVFGTEGLEILKSTQKGSTTAELLVPKFARLIGNLTSENQRNEGEQIRNFCQAVYDIDSFDLGELTSWLSPDQKLELGRLIQDHQISDDGVYERIFEFYENAEHKKKMNAQKIIESSCKRFVRRMFGNEIATKLAERRQDENFTAQMLSAELAMYAAEIKDKKNRIKAQKSIPICNRIYFGYKGDCFCNGHSSTCNPVTHDCLNCDDNTFGVQCEKCLDGFEGSALMDQMGCISVNKRNEFTDCFCNNHSTQCNEDGECFSCLHNTTGNHCENCAEGFYGDATYGTVEDCIPCPCPNGGDCFINGDALVECRTCPNGTYGSTCELKQQWGTTKITETIKRE